jgi:hypothetical protein
MPSFSSHVRLLALGAPALFVLILAAAPAVAQYYYPAPRAYPPAPPPPQAMLAPHHADAVVRSLGLTPLGRAQPHGPTLIVPAMGQEGTQVRVTLDRRTGRVLEIMRIGPSAPSMATLPAPTARGPYEADDEGEPAGYENDEVYPPLVRGQQVRQNYPEPERGPAVITREGIRSQDLPPPGAGPRIVERGPDVTGSVPLGPYVRERGVAPRSVPGSVDPRLGVPKEFRGQQHRTAARAPADSIPRIAPLPRPRPADAPTVAQSNAASEPSAAPAMKEPSLPPEARQDAEKFPPVQPLE